MIDGQWSWLNGALEPRHGQWTVRVSDLGPWILAWKLGTSKAKRVSLWDLCYLWCRGEKKREHEDDFTIYVYVLKRQNLCGQKFLPPFHAKTINPLSRGHENSGYSDPIRFIRWSVYILKRSLLKFCSLIILRSCGPGPLERGGGSSIIMIDACWRDLRSHNIQFSSRPCGLVEPSLKNHTTYVLSPFNDTRWNDSNPTRNRVFGVRHLENSQLLSE